MSNKGQKLETRLTQIKGNNSGYNDFVLEKSIFSNIFEKDIRRVYIYKKAERLAKAIHLITPAFTSSLSLRNRLDAVAIGLVDAAILPPTLAKEAFSRELLALSSVLAIARSGGLLSPMNANLISSEAHALLAEIAAYEEPRLFLDESPTLASLAKEAQKEGGGKKIVERKIHSPVHKGHQSDRPIVANERRQAILSVIKDKGTVHIKDISTVVREISEKTIQRELSKLVQEGALTRSGDRRWTVYSLAS